MDFLKRHWGRLVLGCLIVMIGIYLMPMSLSRSLPRTGTVDVSWYEEGYLREDGKFIWEPQRMDCRVDLESQKGRELRGILDGYTCHRSFETLFGPEVVRSGIPTSHIWVTVKGDGFRLDALLFNELKLNGVVYSFGSDRGEAFKEEMRAFLDTCPGTESSEE